MHTLHKRFIRSIASVHLWNSNTFSPNLCTFVLHNFASSGNDDYLATPPLSYQSIISSWLFSRKYTLHPLQLYYSKNIIKNLYIHSLARVGQWLILCPWRPQGTSLQKLLGYSRRLGGSSILVHCCPLSLWYLDAETGYRVATPYTRVLEINEALGAKVDQSGSFFLQNVFFIYMTKLWKKSSPLFSGFTP